MIKALLNKLRPSFEEGGKLEWLSPCFEAFETILLTPDKVTSCGAHIRDALDIKRYMAMVIVALLPATFMGAWNVGYQHYVAAGTPAGLTACLLLGLEKILPIIIVSYVVGGFWEVLFALVRRHEINEGFLVTGLLFPLTCPPTMPLWQVAVGISFGVVIGKEVFGGTGMNIFNPALTARCFLFFAYPAAISGDKVWAAVDYSQATDAVTGATPLLAVSSEKIGEGLSSAGALLSGFHGSFAAMDYSWLNCFLGFIPGSIGETSTLACLLGAILLLVTGIASWRTMAGIVAGAFGMSLVLGAFASEGRNLMLTMPFYWHLVVGGFAFGTVFMATDPVSSAVTKSGKWIYGILIGVLVMLIRTVNPAYPEGMMLAILFMNAFAPTIDYFVAQANIRRRRLAHAR